MGRAQQPPAAAAARILLAPRSGTVGDRATLAVLDVNGRLTPGAKVLLSTGERIRTDTTGRAAFVMPSEPGILYASLAGRPGRIPIRVVSAGDSASLTVQSAPRFANLADRFELSGNGFCGDADANHVTAGGLPALVLAASSRSLVILPPPDLDPGPARVTLACGSRLPVSFSVSFVSLELAAPAESLAPGERRELLVRVGGTQERIALEARNLAPEVAELAGGTRVRLSSAGGAENSARLEIVGRKRGTILVSIRLAPVYAAPRP